jgi:hypothetical protein
MHTSEKKVTSICKATHMNTGKYWLAVTGRGIHSSGPLQTQEKGTFNLVLKVPESLCITPTVTHLVGSDRARLKSVGFFLMQNSLLYITVKCLACAQCACGSDGDYKKRSHGQASHINQCYYDTKSSTSF